MRLVTSHQEAINTAQHPLWPTFFVLEGKSGHLHYAGAVVVAHAIGLLAYFAVASVSPPETLWPLFAYLTGTIACLVVPTIRRLSDIGLPPLWGLLLLVPVIQYVWLLIMLLVPGHLAREAKAAIKGPEPNADSPAMNEDR